MLRLDFDGRVGAEYLHALGHERAGAAGVQGGVAALLSGATWPGCGPAQRRRRCSSAATSTAARRPIDLHNPKANQHSPGYTPEERQWFRRLAGRWLRSTPSGTTTPRPPGTTRGGATGPARAQRNVGWRLDHLAGSTRPCNRAWPGPASGPTSCIPDHCPAWMEIGK
ncbi:MAG: hypothetical protein WKG07_09240 [Hymenobacter sp.]